MEASGARHGPFDAVVNALWEGRPAIDRTVGHRPDTAEQHRYRVSLFVRTGRPVDAPSAVVAVGPFGDVKSYSAATSTSPGTRRACSPGPRPSSRHRSPPWERRTASGSPPRRSPGSARSCHRSREIERAAGEVRVEGGWVYSQGRGRLDDPAAGVHRRSSHGISRQGSYFSVDTGKYSVAPTRAEELARIVVADA